MLTLILKKQLAEVWKSHTILLSVNQGLIFPGVHYYSGQLFDMKAITEAGHRKVCHLKLKLNICNQRSIQVKPYGNII